MESERAPRPDGTDLGLQILREKSGIEVVFTANEGEFQDISEAENYFREGIKKETKEIRKIVGVMGLATVFQVYQIIDGVSTDNPRAIIPVCVVGALMFYVRNSSLRPRLENRKIAEKKLDLLEAYEDSPDTIAYAEYDTLLF